MPLVLRRATLSDAPSIAANIKGANTPEEIAEQIKIFRDRGSFHLIADADGQVVGNALLSPSRYFPPGEPHRGELTDFVVAPSHQGTGLSRRLVEAVAEEARHRGMAQLETACDESNRRAVRAYAALGFVEWGRLPNATAQGGMIFFHMPLVQVSHEGSLLPRQEG